MKYHVKMTARPTGPFWGVCLLLGVAFVFTSRAAEVVEAARPLYEITQQALTRSVIARLDIPRMRTFLTAYTQFHNRFHSSSTGAQAGDWLFAQIQQRIRGSGYPGVVSAEQVAHAGILQKSVIVRVFGTGSRETLVLGAHLDSINIASASLPVDARAPGADDDGSGTATILEALTLLLELGHAPTRNIEFHFYAGHEDAGFRGSKDIVQSYASGPNPVPVLAMVQFDMTGHLSANPRIGFVTENTDAQLTQFLQRLADTYLDYGWTTRGCGFPCSDHTTWNAAGVPAAFPFEDDANPRFHTEFDTLEFINYDHMAEFVKLAVGFAVEMSV